MALIVGTFETQGEAEAALAQLLAAGFAEQDIALVDNQAQADVPGAQDPRRDEGGVPVALFATAVGVIIGGGLFGPIGAVIGGLTTGGLLGATMERHGITRDELERYESRLRKGRYSLAVSTVLREDEARRLLRAAGAADVDEESA